jgi:hypothetical protein
MNIFEEAHGILNKATTITGSSFFFPGPLRDRNDYKLQSAVLVHTGIAMQELPPRHNK